MITFRCHSVHSKVNNLASSSSTCAASVFLFFPFSPTPHCYAVRSLNACTAAVFSLPCSLSAYAAAPVFSLLCSVNAYAALLHFHCHFRYARPSRVFTQTDRWLLFDAVFVMCITDVTSEGAGVCVWRGGVYIVSKLLCSSDTHMSSGCGVVSFLCFSPLCLKN